MPAYASSSHPLPPTHSISQTTGYTLWTALNDNLKWTCLHKKQKQKHVKNKWQHVCGLASASVTATRSPASTFPPFALLCELSCCSKLHLIFLRRQAKWQGMSTQDKHPEKPRLSSRAEAGRSGRVVSLCHYQTWYKWQFFLLLLLRSCLRWVFFN